MKSNLHFKQGGHGLFLSMLLISHNNKELFDGVWILGNGGDQTVSLVDLLCHHGESNSPYLTCLIIQADPHISRATSHLPGISPRLHGEGGAGTRAPWSGIAVRSKREQPVKHRGHWSPVMKTTKWPSTDKYNYHYCTERSNTYNSMKSRMLPYSSSVSSAVLLSCHQTPPLRFLCNMATSFQIKGSFLTNLSDAEALISAFNLRSLCKNSSPESIQQTLVFDEHSKITSEGKIHVKVEWV